VLWDPKRKVTISHDLIHDGSDYTPYEGLEVTGWPVLTMLRGKVVVDDGALVGAKGYGSYLPRTKPPARAASQP
jgi:dihydropyrimidinase